MLAVGADVAEPTINERTLKVSGLSLNGDTVSLTVSAEADDPFAGTVFVSANAVTVKLVVKSADSLDGEWKETEVEKTFTITEGAVSDTFTFTLSELGLDTTKGFFKVEVKQ